MGPGGEDVAARKNVPQVLVVGARAPVPADAANTHQSVDVVEVGEDVEADLVRELGERVGHAGEMVGGRRGADGRTPAHVRSSAAACGGDGAARRGHRRAKAACAAPSTAVSGETTSPAVVARPGRSAARAQCRAMRAPAAACGPHACARAG